MPPANPLPRSDRSQCAKDVSMLDIDFHPTARPELKILIVDDDAVHARSVRDVLAAHNYVAEIETSGNGGLAKLRSAHSSGEPFQVLVLDLHIPDLPGLKVLEAINAAGLSVKTIVLSGERELETVTPILQLGAIDYLPKPSPPQQLITSVANALSRFQLEAEIGVMHAQAEEDARLYEFLLNAAPDLVYMLGKDGEFQFINHQLDNIFDAKLDGLTTQHWASLFAGHPELIQRLSHQFNERRTGVRATIAEEFTYTTNIGTQHSLELSSIGLYEGRNANQVGDFLGTYGIVRDVTEARRTRRQLQQSQRKFYSLFADSLDAIFISRIEDGEIVERNPSFVAMAKAMSSDVLDRAHNRMDAEPLLDSFLWDNEQARAACMADLHANPNHHEWSFERPVQGEQRFFEVHARRIEIEQQLCMVATLHDRTHERRAEQDRLTLQQQLHQAGRMEAIGQIAGGIAHDFNNILASIIGYAELILNSRARLADEQVDQYLDEVVTAGHRARDLISQMLTFTRAQRGEAQATDVTTTIQDVSRMLRAAIPTSIEVQSNFEPDLPSVHIDPVQIQQIVINLLINARDAISGNGSIIIDVERHRGHVQCRTCGEDLAEGSIIVRVRDTGHGIAPELFEKIFDMYFTTRPPDQGTGYGLWMVNNFVHEAGGHITLHSEVDQGTEFRIALPAAQEHSPVVAPSVPAPAINGRIVVVDDEVSVGNFIGEVLRDKGYPTVVFSESPQALDYLKENMSHIALLITDGSMPLISGVELVEHLRSSGSALPVMFVTAYTQSTDVNTLAKLGVNKYLQKPFSIEEMLAGVEELTSVKETVATSDDLT